MARPNLSYLKNLIIALVGFPCGVLTGLTGIGNSVVVAPMLRWLLGLRPERLSGTALAATAFASLASLPAYAQTGNIRWGLAILLVAGQIVGVGWGHRLSQAVPVLTRLGLLWALLVIFLGLLMLSQGLGLTRMASSYPYPRFAEEGFGLVGWAFLVGVLVGFLSRVFGLGGVLVVPAAIYGLHLPPHAAQGTALVVLLLAGLPAALLHVRRGDLDPQSATWLSFGAVFGGLVGAWYAIYRLHTGAILLVVLGVVLTLLGIGMLWRKGPAGSLS